ncbi:MAG TPA: tetratricopeptide repeat protein [Chryseosolibacter sp.]
MNDGLNPTPKASNKSKTYFVIGFVLLFVMAITWALDDSFVYTSLGAAVFFFFLAYNNRTRPSSASPSYQSYQARARHQQSARPRSFVEDILNSLHQTKTGRTSSPRPQSRQQEANRKVVMMAILIIGSVFFVITLSVFFAEGTEAEVITDNEFYDKAEAARYNGQYDSAEYYYKKVLDKDPEHLNALNGLGILSLSRERYDLAVNQFDNVLRVDPDYKYARYNKALTLYYQRNYRGSLNETFNLLKRSPDYYDAMQLAGDNYYDQQRYDSAKYWYDQGYDSGVRNAWICHVLGYLNDRSNNTQRAVDLYREALSYDSSKVDIYVRLGEMFPGTEGNFYRTKAAQLKQNAN